MQAYKGEGDEDDDDEENGLDDEEDDEEDDEDNERGTKRKFDEEDESGDVEWSVIYIYALWLFRSFSHVSWLLHINVCSDGF